MSWRIGRHFDLYAQFLHCQLLTRKTPSMMRNGGRAVLHPSSPRGREKALLDAIREPIWDLETVIGNEPVFGSALYPSIEDRESLGTPFEKLNRVQATWLYKPGRTWRWHFWHWRIQIHPLQHFKRWALSRVMGRMVSWRFRLKVRKRGRVLSSPIPASSR